MKDDNKSLVKRILNAAVDINESDTNPAVVVVTLNAGLMTLTIRPGDDSKCKFFTCPINGVWLRNENTLEEAWEAIMEVANDGV